MLKVPKGKLPADADLVVTLGFKQGIGFYLFDEQRWVVSDPQQHHARGSKKEKAANNRFKRTIRMFKAARNRLVDKGALTKDDAPSYFIECLLYNVPDHLFEDKLAPTYTGILDWLKTAKLNDFECQNGQVPLFGPGREQWSVKKARAFVRAMQELWDMGAEDGRCSVRTGAKNQRRRLNCGAGRHSDTFNEPRLGYRMLKGETGGQEEAGP